MISKKINRRFLWDWLRAGVGISISSNRDGTQTISATGSGGRDATRIITSTNEPQTGELLPGDFWFQINN